MNREEYYSILTSIQNRMRHTDILTFTAFMDSDEELLNHLFRYMWEVEGLA